MARPAAIVKDYLYALANSANRRGRVSTDILRTRLRAIEAEIEECTDVIYRLKLHQRAVETREQITALQAGDDFATTEKMFIENVKDWAQGKNVSYESLRSAGVPARVLREAGMA